MAKNNYKDSPEMTQDEIDRFVAYMNSGEEVIGGSEEHRLMTAASERAMRITSRMNAQFDSLSDTRAQLEELWMCDLPDNVGVFPPFTTDCGLNTHIGEGVFINAGCRFQDHPSYTNPDAAQHHEPRAQPPVSSLHSKRKPQNRASQHQGCPD